MSADKRSVSTDALETLGTIIDDTQKRDAIHLVSDGWFHGYCAAAIVAAVFDFVDAIVGYVRFERERRARQLAERSEL